MKRVHSLGFDSLEERKLLSRAHAVTHARPAAATPALVLNGTLTVNNKGASEAEDDQGDITTSTPVAGQLAGIGEVHGIWNESSDQYGDYEGPDTLQLHNAKGTFTVAFSEQDIQSVNHLAGGAEEDVEPQLASQGTRAYAHTHESGTIDLYTNAARTRTVSMVLSS